MQKSNFPIFISPARDLVEDLDIGVVQFAHLLRKVFHLEAQMMNSFTFLFQESFDERAVVSGFK